MDREEAMKLGVGMLANQHMVDTDGIVRKFVNILYDSNNGITSDEDIYPDIGPDMDGTATEEYPEPRSPDWMYNEINTLRGHFRDVMDEMEIFVDTVPVSGDYTEPEPRITRMKKSSRRRLEITSEWLEENDDGTFDRFVSVIKSNGVEVVLGLSLVSYDEGSQVKVAYDRVY